MILAQPTVTGSPRPFHVGLARGLQVINLGGMADDQRKGITGVVMIPETRTALYVRIQNTITGFAAQEPTVQYLVIDYLTISFPCSILVCNSYLLTANRVINVC